MAIFHHDPEHDDRACRKYHYYITASKTDTAAGSGWRLPAKDIERIMINGLRDALSNPARLIDFVTGSTSRSASVRQIQHAASRAYELAADVNRLKSTLLRIDVQHQKVEVTVSGAELCAALDLPDRPNASSHVLTIPVQLRRRGVENAVSVLRGGYCLGKIDT